MPSFDPTTSVPQEQAFTTATNDEFVPLGAGYDGEDSDSDDGPIPEIDMRSNSDDE